MINLNLGSITAQVIQKDIQNIHLSVYPPMGNVRVSAPEYMSLDAIKIYIISKLGWIKQQQRKFQNQQRETPRTYVTQESHYVWGKRYLLKVEESNHSTHIDFTLHHLIFKIKPNTNQAKRDAIMAAWYRNILRDEALILIEKWQSILNVSINALYICKMKTRWGSCTPHRKNIRLNTELAKKPIECVEYIILHELLHLIDPTHGEYFQALLNQYLPNWHQLRTRLNELPIHQ